MAFYKKDNPEATELLEAPNFVINANYELRSETWEQNVYPTDGWYWFDTQEEAYSFFNLPLPGVNT